MSTLSTHDPRFVFHNNYDTHLYNINRNPNILLKQNYTNLNSAFFKELSLSDKKIFS